MRITVAAQGWMPQMKKIEIAASLPAVDFRLQPGKKLLINFVDATGKPIPKVGVVVDTWQGPNRSTPTVTPTSSTYKFPTSPTTTASTSGTERPMTPSNTGSASKASPRPPPALSRARRSTSKSSIQSSRSPAA